MQMVILVPFSFFLFLHPTNVEFLNRLTLMTGPTPNSISSTLVESSHDLRSQTLAGIWGSCLHGTSLGSSFLICGYIANRILIGKAWHGRRPQDLPSTYTIYIFTMFCLLWLRPLLPMRMMSLAKGNRNCFGHPSQSPVLSLGLPLYSSSLRCRMLLDFPTDRLQS